MASLRTKPRKKLQYQNFSAQFYAISVANYKFRLPRYTDFDFHIGSQTSDVLPDKRERKLHNKSLSLITTTCGMSSSFQFFLSNYSSTKGDGSFLDKLKKRTCGKSKSDFNYFETVTALTPRCCKKHFWVITELFSIRFWDGESDIPSMSAKNFSRSSKSITVETSRCNRMRLPWLIPEKEKTFCHQKLYFFIVFTHVGSKQGYLGLCLPQLRKQQNLRL